MREDEVTAAAARVDEFLRQRRAMVQLDPEQIGSVYSDLDAEPANLFVADLQALVDAARTSTHDGPVDPWERYAQRD